MVATNKGVETLAPSPFSYSPSPPLNPTYSSLQFPKILLPRWRPEVPPPRLARTLQSDLRQQLIGVPCLLKCHPIPLFAITQVPKAAPRHEFSGLFLLFT